MNWVDGLVIGIVVVYALIGLRRGFLVVAAELVTLVIGLVVAFLAFRPVGAMVAAATGKDPALVKGACFFALWVIVQGLSGLAFRLWLRKVPKDVMRSPVNRLWGTIPSAIKGVIAACLIVTLLSVAPTGTAAKDVRTSLLGRMMADATTGTLRVAANEFADVLQAIQPLMGRETEVEGFKKLPFQTTDVEVDPAAEAQMLDLVNQERTSRGLQPLVMDPVLRVIAREHSKDMLARGYFAHETPPDAKGQRKSPFDRMHAAGIEYTIAGENLAFTLTVEMAHDGLMKSPGHRKNILTPEFARVGIGAIRAGARGTMFTQDFTN